MLCYTASSLFVYAYVIHATAACILFLTLVFARGEQAPPQPNCQQGIHTTRRVFFTTAMGASTDLLKMVCFVCTTCNPLLPNQIEYTVDQLKRFVGLLSWDKSGSGCFKCSKTKLDPVPRRATRPLALLAAPPGPDGELGRFVFVGCRRRPWHMRALQQWAWRSPGAPAAACAGCCCSARTCRAYAAANLLLPGGRAQPAAPAHTPKPRAHGQAHGPSPIAFGCGLPVNTARCQLIRICPNT